MKRPFGAGFSLLVLFVLLALLAAACGGSSNKNSASSGNSGSSAAASSGASGPAGGTLPITGTLDSLNSYRWEVTLQGKGAVVSGLDPSSTGSESGPANDTADYDVKGAWLKPDKAQMELKAGSLSVKQTVVGNQQWTTVAGTTQGPVPADESALQDLQLAGFFDVQDIFGSAQGFDCGGSQSVNGVQATVCQADKSDYQNLAQDVGGLLDNAGIDTVDDFSLKIYVAKDGGYVVKTDMDMQGKGTDGKDFTLAIHLNVTDINKVNDISPS